MALTISERQRIQFAFNAYLDSVVGVIFNYLIKNSHFPSRVGKHKGVDAMMAFWKPFAYQEQGNLSEAELQTIAVESVETLTHQINLICAAFGLESPQAKVPTNLKQEIREAIHEAVQTFLAQPELAVSASGVLANDPYCDQAEPEGGDFDEDSLLGNLLDGAAIAA